MDQTKTAPVEGWEVRFRKTFPSCAYFISDRSQLKRGNWHTDGELKDFIDKELSQARKEAIEEERERIKKTLQPIEKEDLLPIESAIDKWVKFHDEMGGEVIWQDTTIDDEYARKRPVRVIYYSPLKTFQEIQGITNLSTQKESE